MEGLLEGEAEALGRKAVELALAGEVSALRLCLERVSPVRRGRPVSVALSPCRDAAGLVEGGAALIAATASGDLTPDESSVMISMLSVQRQTIETADLEARIQALEGGGGAESMASNLRSRVSRLEIDAGGGSLILVPVYIGLLAAEAMRLRFGPSGRAPLGAKVVTIISPLPD